MMKRRILTTLLLSAAVQLTAAELTVRAKPVPQWIATQTMWDSGTYTFDGAGNVMSVGTDRYRYDGAKRLTGASAHTPSSANLQTYQYDARGNLLRVDTQTTPTAGTAASVTMVMAIDAGTNRLIGNPTQTDCPTGVICVSGTYDEAGRQKSMNGTVSYEWDALGNMTEIRSLGRLERYVYDAGNERIASILVSGSAERRLYTLRGSDSKVLRELVDRVNNGVHQWTWTKDYVYRSGRLLASVAPAANGTTTHHFHLDHLDTPRVITDASGYRLSIHTYWPFGAEAPGSETDGERMKFTGHERDFGGGPGEDLDYMHARHYTPTAARFLSVDPIIDLDRAPLQPQMWNRYAYALNNPLVLIDPTGEKVSLARLDPSQRAALLKSLNEFTGNTYDVDQNYELILVAYGANPSVTATQFLQNAINSQDTYQVTGVSGDKNVLFGSADQKTNIITIDFKDFSGINYGNFNPNTFSIGSIVIHELIHTHNGILDPSDADKYKMVGPVVDMVNRMREERGFETRGPSYGGYGFGNKVEIPFIVQRRGRFLRALLGTEGAIHATNY